jgi:phosphoribosylglycinamide formyltransferase-1
MKLVVLISGSGSNLQTFIDQCQSGDIAADIAAVISNKAEAFGLERATKAGIATACVDHKAFDSREAFDQALSEVIDSHQPDLIILAGFMRILTPGFVEKYLGKMMNIHPSLLPKYPGLNTHQRAIDAGDNKAGATVHFVTPELDGGPAIVQAEVNISATDTAESLAQKVLNQEHLIYPMAVKWFCEKRLLLNNNKTVLDGKTLDEHGHLIQSTKV